MDTSTLHPYLRALHAAGGTVGDPDAVRLVAEQAADIIMGIGRAAAFPHVTVDLTPGNATVYRLLLTNLRHTPAAAGSVRAAHVTGADWVVTVLNLPWRPLLLSAPIWLRPEDVAEQAGINPERLADTTHVAVFLEEFGSALRDRGAL